MSIAVAQVSSTYSRDGELLRTPQLDEFAANVVRAAGETYGLSTIAVLGRCRTKRVTLARQAVAWALRRALCPLNEISTMLGRDRQTIIHAIRATERKMQTDPYLLARNMGLLDACGILRPEGMICGVFVGVVQGNRAADFLEVHRKASDMCKRPGCGQRRGQHA